MKCFVIYHRADFDGVGSCLVVKKYFKEQGFTVECFGWNYGDDVPNINGILLENDYIVIVDISFPADIMMALGNTGKCIWIDHHITAIEDSVSLGYQTMPGIRESQDKSAVELCWNYFYKTEAPLFIQYLSAYDIWNKTRFSWQTDVLPLQYGLNAKYGMSERNLGKDFDLLLSDTDKLRDLIMSGQMILEYLKKQWRSWVRGHAFEITVAGKYKGICMLTAHGGSLQFDSVSDKYDIFVTVNRMSDDKFNIGMYTEHEIPEFSCGDYVKTTYGTGGGHATSCGCTLNYLQFKNLLENKEI